ncbi:MAG: AAA family ATPase [Planctomycetes bacterium]|nr:AAA family ATPase [Planctomycetota bacterium]
MSVITIRKAERTGARGVFGFAGPSGSGKTLSALYFSWGLANGDASKIGFLDTENRRGSLYSDKLVDKEGNVRRFNIADLVPPFSPDRYATAIQEFQAAGIEVLIIDSVTHEWEGTGGCEEIASAAKKPSIGWMNAKKAHKRFMNMLLQCNMHVVCCIRAREKTSFQNPSKPVSLGIQPICEKNFMFEMTASVMMADEGRTQYPMKCPDDLREFLGGGNGYVSAKNGLGVRRWIDGAGEIKNDVEEARSKLLMTTEAGIDAVEKLWNETPERIRFDLGNDFFIQICESANSFSAISDKTEEPEETFLVG